MKALKHAGLNYNGGGAITAETTASFITSIFLFQSLLCTVKLEKQPNALLQSGSLWVPENTKLLVFNAPTGTQFPRSGGSQSITNVTYSFS